MLRERNTVKALFGSDGNYCEEDTKKYAIIIKELQCWKGLTTRDIGGFNQNSAIVNQGNGKLGVYSLKGISFLVNKNERFVVLGSASSGRSSLLQNIVGLDKILSGRVIIEGRCNSEIYKNLSNLHGLIGYQPQQDTIDPELSVWDHLTYFANLAGVCPNVQEERVTQMIDKLGLSLVQDVKASDLSQGYRRRLTLAMALIGRPKIVLLDDPCSGVDPAATQKVLRTIREETKDSTLLVCTQIVEVAEALADRVAILHEGQFKAIGSVAEVMQNTGSKFTIEA